MLVGWLSKDENILITSLQMVSLILMAVIPRTSMNKDSGDIAPSTT